MYLIDTNIFLEILLGRKKSKKAKRFLQENRHLLAISEFTLDSIGIVLLNQKRYELFKEFIEDVLPKVEVLRVPKELYSTIADISKEYGLDFDDAYQCALALIFDLKIVTLDKHFKKVEDIVEVIFL